MQDTKPDPVTHAADESRVMLMVVFWVLYASIILKSFAMLKMPDLILAVDVVVYVVIPIFGLLSLAYFRWAIIAKLVDEFKWSWRGALSAAFLGVALAFIYAGSTRAKGARLELIC